MVATDGQTVTVTGHLPNGQLRMRGLDACSYRCAAAVNGIETVGRQVVRHTAGAAYTRDDSYLVRLNAYLCHGFL